MQRVYFLLGWLALGIGAVGVAVPLLPTVPFVILAAFLFAKGNPEWERRLVEHPKFGPHINAWRARGAISRRGKMLAIAMLAGSAAIGAAMLDMPWGAAPGAVALLTGVWIGTRPDA